MGRVLVGRAELLLHEGGAWALWAALALRWGVGYLFTKHSWLLDSQLFAAAVILALLYGIGCLLPRRPGEPFSYILGGLAWLSALSLARPYGWPRLPLPAWLLWAGTLLLLAALVLRYVRRRAWLKDVRGHGHAFIVAWAAERSFYARLLAQGVLRTIGYRG